MPYFANYGTKEQKDHYIPKMTSGELVGAIGMTEPDAGSDLQGIRTRAKKDGDDYILNGSKVFITNGILGEICNLATFDLVPPLVNQIMLQPMLSSLLLLLTQMQNPRPTA